ncbi:MAG TPA: class I SAM-dependent methyltransferase [bacterium]|nr:class I SAM-dependent methyltransferase [bacterium]HPN42114.1 class I SAM-dependent methyltransferase [bacterium]
MNVEKLLTHAQKPALYAPGTAVMWTDPYIAQQLLACHINPDHDIASRSNTKIELVVNWMLTQTPKERMSILDLGCGPGLYAEKLARLGHRVTGVDFSQTSIDHACQQTAANQSGITYYCNNYLNITFENEFDLVILIYMDFCVLKPAERKIVLDNVYRALKPGGTFIFDVVNSKNIAEKTLKPSWEVCEQSFWSNKPYLALNTGYYYAEHKVLLNQHIVINEQDEIKTYLFWSTCYDDGDLQPLLAASHFKTVGHFDNVLPAGDVWNGDNVTFYVAEK